MRILIYGINYSPELTGVGKYSGEMADWLAKHHHDVRVVTAPPYYPSWRVFSKYSGRRWVKETLHHLTVFRCPLWVPSKPSGVKRLLHLATFALSSFPVMAQQVFWNPDVILVVEPPLFCAPTAWLVARISGAKVWLHIQDYEVDAAFDLGLIKGSILKSIVISCERFLMGRFDRVSSISKRMLEKAMQKAVKDSKLVHFPNWVEIHSPISREESLRSEFNIPSNAFVALYSGNMGNKQGLEILADASGLLKNVPNLTFVFCGNGSGREELISRCSGLSNVIFLDLQPAEKLPRLLAMADVHLLPQRADAADLVMPSKLTGIFASGRPVVATAKPRTEVANVVEGNGLVVTPEDPDAFAGAIKRLMDDHDLREGLGQSARRFAEQNLDRDVILKRFEADLLECINER